MGELQLPVTIYQCGKQNSNPDVSIRLVPNEVNQQQVNDLPLLKVHSHRLKECSKYFEACLSERWANPNPSTASTEFSLEVIHGLQVSCYTDCFSRMYAPFRKDFKDVESSVNLLRVASQIEFRSLMSSICRHLSTMVWSVEDELRIRLFASSQDFPRGHAKDLVTRLELGDPSSNSCRKLLFELLVKCLKSALRCKHRDKQVPRRNFPNARSLIEELLRSVGRSESPGFERDLVVLINDEVEDILEDFHEECLRKGSYNRITTQFRRIFGVPGFKHKLEGICWILKVMLKAQVADDVVNCFLQLQSYPRILAAVAAFSPFVSIPAAKAISAEVVQLVMLIYREAVSGNLLLDIEDRVALLENWQLHDLCHESRTVITTSHEWGFEEAAEKLFLTLPFKQQMEFIKRRKFDHGKVISTEKLASLVLENCRAEEYARMQADPDVDMG